MTFVMQCKNCGSNLIKGFSFCIDCGSPVPPEFLEESGLPTRNTDDGTQNSYASLDQSSQNEQTDEITGDLKPQLQGNENNDVAVLKPNLHGGETFDAGSALKPTLIGNTAEEAGKALKPKIIGSDDEAGGGSKVKAAMQDTSVSNSDNSTDKLIFCPNCGMHMQKNPFICEICGMPIDNKQNTAPTTAGGIPLFNTDTNPFGNPFGMGGFNGNDNSFNGFPDNGIPQINNIADSNSVSMFNNNENMFNSEPSSSDLATLTEQLANFSAAASETAIKVTENTRIRQSEPQKGHEREVVDFSMSDDLSSESIPISDNGVPIIGDYSMDENPDKDINLDPYSFLSTSMDEEIPEPPEPEEPKEELPAPITENVPKQTPQTVEKATETPSEPDYPEPLAALSDDDFESEEPFIAEESPVISEFDPNAEIKTAAVSNIAAPKNEFPEPLTSNVQSRSNIPTAQSAAVSNAVPPVAPPKPPQTKVPQNNVSHAPRLAANMKWCKHCRKQIPIQSDFCPFCGVSAGVPNVNTNPVNTNPTPNRAPADKKKTIAIVCAIIFIVAVIVVVIVSINLNMAQKYSEEFRQNSENAELFANQITYFLLQ